MTGASAGLGAAIVREIARRGRASSFVLVARRKDRLDELADEVRQTERAPEVLTIAVDLADPDGCRRVADEALARFGGIDVLMNNAGLGLPTLFADAPVQDLDRQIAVNFRAPIILTRFLAGSLRERRGMVVNIGSAITCVANSALGVYGATKAGLAYWNDAIRRELSNEGLTVCLVEPGPIRTEFTEAFQKLATDGARAHPVVETPSEWMTADVQEVARRVVDLLDRPKRRLSVLRRMVWPFRAVGALVWAFPALGDWFVTRVFQVDQASGRGRKAE
ncbi:SDR family NAD(P)-dependent oxidoreductase [Paludisphaera rhizosphaerae]|uniref:SDR family NAD(P)-dependent oxidoreductase n=1 Tax=Paludisphaera rhizosphaerae TaxID=2711216 RepID=UPI001C6EB4AF|nr:SDR family NAD(P)-dependent oxidoreductase [Paludisphaera rhizosphaerae]